MFSGEITVKSQDTKGQANSPKKCDEATCCGDSMNDCKSAAANETADNTCCEITVVVATRDRACQLERMLTSLEQQTVECWVKVIVVDNGSKDNTQEVIARKSGCMNLVDFFEREGSKSKALNRALDHVSGGLVVFADDDVTCPPNWLQAYQEAAMKFPCASVFCGPVVPDFPIETPQWLRAHPICGPLFFARYEPGYAEGPLPEPLTEMNFPFGANYAVRASALKNIRFRTDLGPSEENGPLYDEDTEFFSRLHDQVGEFIFAPGAKVAHHIDARRTEWSTLFEKAFHYGRTVAIRNCCPVPPIEHPSFPFADEDASTIEKFETGCVLNFLCGQLYEFQMSGQEQFECMVNDMLEPFNIPANRALLSNSAMMLSILTPAMDAHESACLQEFSGFPGALTINSDPGLIQGNV